MINIASIPEVDAGLQEARLPVGTRHVDQVLGLLGQQTSFDENLLFAGINVVRKVALILK